MNPGIPRPGPCLSIGTKYTGRPARGQGRAHLLVPLLPLHADTAGVGGCWRGGFRALGPCLQTSDAWYSGRQGQPGWGSAAPASVGRQQRTAYHAGIAFLRHVQGLKDALTYLCQLVSHTEAHPICVPHRHQCTCLCQKAGCVCLRPPAGQLCTSFGSLQVAVYSCCTATINISGGPVGRQGCLGLGAPAGQLH